MNRRDFLPTYHFEDTENNEIKDLAEEKLRDYVITGNHGKNLIPFPYVGKSGTQNGVTITVDSDGVITLNGTATSGIYFGLMSPVNSSVITKPGKYTISGMPAGAVSGISIQCYVDESWGSKYTDVGNGATFTVTSSIKYVTLQIYSGTVCDNVVIKPMLEEGETKTEFEPWCGVGDKTKNLLPNDWELGFISIQSGENQSSSTYVRTKDYFTFDISKNYYISSDSIDTSATISWYIYDENKNFISRFVSYKNRTIGTSGCQVTIPTNAVFFRLAVLTTDINIKVQIEEGTTATEYEPYGYKIELLNKPWNNLINVDDFESTQTNGYYAGISTPLTDSNMSTYLPYLDEMKGKSVVFSCDLDNENFRQEFLIYYNVEVNGALKYIEFTQGKNFTAILPDATPIRIECRARSDSADMNGTTVKFSNITLKYEDIKEEKQNIYLKNQITDGKEVSYKTDLLNDIILHKDMINDLSINSKIKPKKVSYSYYTYKYPNKNN